MGLSFRIDREAGAHLLETPLSADQTATIVGEEIEITATVVESAQLQWWLNGFGEEINSVVRRRAEQD